MASYGHWKQWRDAHRKHWRAKAICVECGKAEAAPDASKCHDCRRRRIRRWHDRRMAGLCGECGVIPSERFSRCAFCREIVSEQRKRWWRQAKASVNARRRTS